MKKYLKWFLLLVSGVIGLFVIAFCILSFLVFDSLSPENDPDEYFSYLKEWQSTHSYAVLVEHFPKQLGEQVKVLGFSAQRGFLQGGAYIQLRTQVPANDILRLYGDFSKKATRIYTSGKRTRDQENGMPTTAFYTSSESDIAFPADYEILAFNEYIPKDQSPAGFWNHGETYGVAISRKRHEIVYWAESW